VLVALLTTSAAWVSASPADAATPRLTVQPASQLVDGQLVTIAGSGFTPGATIRVSECLASDVNRCNPFTEAFPTPDQAGAFSYTFKVRREIKVTPGSPEVTDCGASPGRCVFFAVNIANAAERASAPFAFNPNIGPLRFTPSVNQHVDLTNGGFRLRIPGEMGCTLPARIGITGFIWQDARDPNSGYPFNTFVDCRPRGVPWQATVTVAAGDRPFLPGRAHVQVIATGTNGDRQEHTIEPVVLIAR
jgi:hypothetical protein